MLKLILFADDTNLFRSGYKLDELCKEISIELSKLNLWFKVNKLSLNVSKTNFMVFGGRKKSETVTISINNSNIERVHFTKFLGVTIDANLDWKTHINQLVGKLSKCIYVLYKSSKVLGCSSLRILYCSLFLPYISYCCEVWGTTYKTNIHQIIMLQKKAIRIVCNKGRFEHTTPLFYQQKILKFNDLVDLRCGILMYKALHLELPTNLQKMFILHKDTDCYKLRSFDKFKVCFARTNHKANCLSIYGVSLFNSLPNSLTSARSIMSFKKRYMKILIDSYH